jgi:hypothetical protein
MDSVLVGSVLMSNWYDYGDSHSGGKVFGPYDCYLVEADSPEEADARAVGTELIYFEFREGVDCSHCGERFRRAYEHDDTDYEFIDWYLHFKTSGYKVSRPDRAIRAVPKNRPPFDIVEAADFYDGMGIRMVDYQCSDEWCLCRNQRYMELLKDNWEGK